LKKRSPFLYILSREMTGTKISSDELFPLPICDIMVIRKSVSPGGSLKNARSLRDMGFTLCLCNTKAKLSIKS
jgi:hypothetical protein